MNPTPKSRTASFEIEPLENAAASTPNSSEPINPKQYLEQLETQMKLGELMAEDEEEVPEEEEEEEDDDDDDEEDSASASAAASCGAPFTPFTAWPLGLPAGAAGGLATTQRLSPLSAWYR